MFRGCWRETTDRMSLTNLQELPFAVRPLWLSKVDKIPFRIGTGSDDPAVTVRNDEVMLRRPVFLTNVQHAAFPALKHGAVHEASGVGTSTQSRQAAQCESHQR